MATLRLCRDTTRPHVNGAKMSALDSGFGIAILASMAEARMRERAETSAQAIAHLAREFELRSEAIEALRQHLSPDAPK
jgi:hypothetical protein